MKQLSKDTSTLLFILLTGVLVVVAFISYNKILLFNRSVGAVMHTHSVKSAIIEVESNLKDAEIGQQGYLLTDDSVFLQPFNDAEQHSNRAFAKLNSLISDNGEQQENLKKLKTLVDERYFLLNTNLILFKNTQPNLFKDSVLLKDKNKMDEIRKQIALMLQTEDELLVGSTQVKDRTATITPVFLLMLSLFSVLIITLFFFRLQKETNMRISITESNMLLQKAKEQIEASEKRFRTLSETIPHMIWTATPDGNRNFFNKYFLEYTGLTFEELKGNGWQRSIFPDDLKRELAQWHHAVKTGEDFKIEKRVRHQSGTFRWHLSHGIAQKDNEGTVTGWIGTNTEIEDQIRITEALAKGEEQFRTFANSIQNLAWIANADGWIYWYNQRWYDYTGTTLEEMEGSGWQKVHHPDHVKKVIEFVKEAWKKDEAMELTFPLRRHDGEYRWFLTRAYPIKDASGNIERWIGTNTDITEQKYFTEELETKVQERTKDLETKNLELENANAELVSFSYVASHDLQEPLRKIQGFSKRIIDNDGEKLSDTTKDYFNRIRAAAQRMQNLIESLLSFSRTNLSEVIFEKTDLNQTLIEVQTVLNELITQKNGVIETQTLPTLNAASVQMHQLFLNLIGNSLKYSKPGIAPHIKITAEKVTIHEVAGQVKQQNGTFWKIAISDNGIGFEQQYEHKIFELFQRLHGKTEYEGTGIGLAICKKIVQLHNGKITATGQPNVGATFTFFLPDNK